MALPAQDQHPFDTDSSDASTTVKNAAHHSPERSGQRPARHRNSSRLKPQTQRSATRSNAQRAPQPQLPKTPSETAHSYREVLEAVREEGAIPIVPRRLRRGHRAFRLTWKTAFVGGVLFCQLLAALWLKALAVSASHHNDKLVQKIADTESGIDKTQRQIAVLGADSHMGDWAAKLGYRQAAQTDLDDVSKSAPLPPIEYSNGTNEQAANTSTNTARQ